MATKTTPQFSPNATQILEQRYLMPGESPQGMLERVSMGNEDYYELMASKQFLPNSPTLFNLDTGVGGTLSACFKFDIQDTLLHDPNIGGSGIMEVAYKAAAVLQAGGGVGYTLSNIRPRGSLIRSTHKKACGPVAVMRLLQSLSLDLITQGGRREAAQMAILHCDHEDLKDFINCKNNDPQALSTFNISVAATNNWMEHQTTSDNPYEEGLLWVMAENAWHTGDPGLYFIDTSERTNPTPWLGKLTGTNPCGEVPLLDNEPCNLGSLNLGQFVLGESFHWSNLEHATRLAIRYLDDVLDHNEFPDPAITDIAMTTRKLGLGVMGWADALALMHIPYDSDYAVQLGEETMRLINLWAADESRAMAEIKGVAPCFMEVPMENSHYFRNATRTCIAPTGSISLLLDASSGIEPHYATEWTRKVSGEGNIVLSEKMINTNGFTPKTAHDIHWSWHIKHQAAFQQHTNLAVSKTINMPNSATVEEIYNAYVEAWKAGCKGVTIFRDGCRNEQVLTHSTPVSTPTLTPSVAVRNKLPTERNAITHKFQVGDQEGYITVGLYPNNLPGELFLTVNKEGSTIAGLLDTVGIMASLALQYGVPIEAITRKLRQVTFEPNGLTANSDIPTATSIPDYIAHWLEHKFIPGAAHQLTYEASQVGEAIIKNGLTCPDCGSMVIATEGCIKCISCGWNRCG